MYKPGKDSKDDELLKKKGFVKTKEGVGGGYILDCNPEEVSLADIYITVSHGTLKPKWCTGDPEKKCVISSNTQIVMNQIFDEAELYFEKYLEDITLSTFLEKLNNVRDIDLVFSLH